MSFFKEIDLTEITTYSAKQRLSKVKTSEEGSPSHAGMTVLEFLDSLPSILKANDLKSVARAIVNAKRNKKPVIAMLGGHVIKTGCSPILADLAINGYISHFAFKKNPGLLTIELKMVKF